jgi:hypothetical protein
LLVILVVAIVNTEKCIFYAAVEGILSYGWEIWMVDYKLKNNLLSTEMDFWRSAPGTSRLLKVRNEVIGEKMGVTQTILERMENNVLKWYGHVVGMEDKRWPKQTVTFSPRGIQKP